MAFPFCLRSPRARKLALVLMGAVLGALVYLLFVQVGPYHMATLSLMPFPQSSVRAGPRLPEYPPKWWTETWSRSAVSGQQSKFSGDRPLFPPCRETPSKKETYHFIERPKYLKNSKNPCWLEEKKSGIKKLKCVPYFYLAGVAKGGTTDLAKRLRLHPEVFQGTEKEYHWWERYRYKYDPDDPKNSGEKKGEMTFEEYTDLITGKDVMKLHSELRITGASKRIFGDFSPSYFWDPQNWYVLEGNHGCLEPRVIVGQHIRHIYPPARIILTFRHPTSRLYSRFVSRIPRTPELKGSTPEDFHKYVVQGIQNYKKCFRVWSVRHCAYNVSVYKDTTVRLVEGMYPVFMADWLRVWPRHQIFLMRYEDYVGHERERIAELVNFLGLTPLNNTYMNKVMAFHPVNSGTKGYQKYGPMLDKTKKILDDFYQPFIDALADMLGDERFWWKDVPH